MPKRWKGEEGGLGFDDLPDEVIVKIFSNLTTKDILANVARVSKRFHRLSLDPDAHVAVQFPHLYCPVSCRPQFILDFLKGKNRIRSVKMEGGSDCSALSGMVLQLAVLSQETLECLELAAWPGLSTAAVVGILALPNLRRLKLSNVEHRPGLLKAIVSSVNPQKTETVDVEGEIRHFWTGKMAFRMTLRNSCLLVEDPTYTFMSEDVAEILSAVAQNDGLRKVDVMVHNPGCYDHKFLLDKGGHFSIRTNLGFMTEAELEEVIDSLSTLPPTLTTAEIDYSIPLPVQLVGTWKSKIPGQPPVIAKMSL